MKEDVGKVFDCCFAIHFGKGENYRKEVLGCQDKGLKDFA